MLCCGSGSGILDPGWEKVSIRNRDEQPSEATRVVAAAAAEAGIRSSEFFLKEQKQKIARK
jgi:hypothetical protein